MKTETLKVKAAKQIMVGSFDYAANKHHRYVPIQRVPHCPDWVQDYAADQHGSGLELDNGTILLLVENANSDIPGDWIIRYRYNDNEGTNCHELFIASEIA